MVKYSFNGERYVIEDFQHAKTFASFLPAVAGVDGKPLWAFYASVGQGMGGFGVTSKDTPITPFDSANLAYSNIPIKSFRTFLKVNGRFVTPFFNHDEVKQTMETSMADFSIKEEGKDYAITVLYNTLPHKSYAALSRKVTYTNTSEKPLDLEAVDGLPIFFPHGLSNFCYKELVSLMAAYCQVYGLEKRTPFVKFKTSTGDNSVVQEAITGNGFFAKDEKGEKLTCLVDPALVFGEDATLLTADPFSKGNYGDFVKQVGQTENKLPCAFYTFKKTLQPGESYSVYAIYGMFDDYERYLAAVEELTPAAIEASTQENRALLSALVEPATCHTSSPLFDLYVKQSYLDNNLRGGFPVLLDNHDGGEVYYVYGRKHGDMERDYNAFQIPSRYYSLGPGNFRDVNQNRRSDLFFHPFVGDYNIKLFFSLIQVDGQNPLNVKPKAFVLNAGAKLDFLAKLKKENKERIASLAKKFEPSEMYTYLIDECGLSKAEAQDLFAQLLGVSHQEEQANFAEGYWVDHWTYNVDLLENYSSVFPDQEEKLFFGASYPYFYSPVYVEPRKEKYCLLPDGKVRQYGAIDLKALKDTCEKRGFNIQETAWLVDQKGQRIEVSLASKLVNLALIKFSTLDSLQMGIEMECEKPGWNDAMNGLPGLFASGLSETVELLRLVRYAEKHLAPFADKTVTLLGEQYRLYGSLVKNLGLLKAGKLDRFAYWNRVTKSREELREGYAEAVKDEAKEVKIAEILPLLSQMEGVLHEGLLRAKKAGGGILPSYLIYDVASYKKTGHINHLGYENVEVTSFRLRTIPPFLEASARAYKLADNTVSEADYEAIKKTDLYDSKLHFYKTCASLDNAPFEIGRVHAFTKGWLERECNFLHMDYKYLLGLLEAGYYDDFYAEAKTNFVFNMDPYVYGRNPTEASSFVVPTCNPDSSKHGRGYFARLTGANAEFLDMYVRLFAGEALFSYEQGKLIFHLAPKLSHQFFDKDGKVSFLLFDKVKVTYLNPKRLDCYKGVHLSYEIHGKRFDRVEGTFAEEIRDGTLSELVVRIS
jgi:hypothetical protein